MDDFLVPEESALSFAALILDGETEEFILDVSDVSDDGGNFADLSVSAIGDEVLVDVDAFAWDGWSSVSGTIEAFA